MSTFRSEMKVPVNKGNVESRDDSDSTIFSVTSTLSNPSANRWCDTFKHIYKMDQQSANRLTDHILSSRHSDSPISIKENNECVILNSENIFRQLQSKIAKGNDDKMHFTAKFDVKDIVEPDQIKVFVKDTSLLMIVEFKEIMNQKFSTYMECSKKFNLPPNIISDSITCTISVDNILILDGILDLSFDQRRNSTNLFDFNTFRKPSLVNSSSSSSLVQSPLSSDKYKICVHIGSHYNPQDISIKTRDDKIFIKARHEEKSDSRTNYSEFSKEIQIPDTIDPIYMSAIFNNGNLSIEAPFNY